MTKLIVLKLLMCITALVPHLASANGSLAPPHRNWSFQGLFGSYERDSAQRGLQVYLEVCSACHALSHVRYGDLAMLGYSEKEIRAIATDFRVTAVSYTHLTLPTICSV